MALAPFGSEKTALSSRNQTAKKLAPGRMCSYESFGLTTNGTSSPSNLGEEGLLAWRTTSSSFTAGSIMV